MPRKLLSIEARALGRLLHDERHRSTRQRVCPDMTPSIDAAKDWTSNDVRIVEPRPQRTHRTQRSTRSMHRHVGTFAELIRFASRNVHDDAFAMPLDVIHVERHELRASKCRGKPHEQERSISRTKQARWKRFKHHAQVTRR